MKSSIFIFLAIFVFCACTNHVKQDPKKAIELNNSATQLINAEQLDSALLLLNKAIACDSNYYQAHANKANIYFKQGKNNLAITETQKAMAINKEYVEGWGFIGFIYDSMEDSVNAIKSYQKCIELLRAKDSHNMSKDQLFNHKANIAFLLIQSGNNTAAQEIINELKKERINDPVVDSMITMTRKKFLENIKTNK